MGSSLSLRNEFVRFFIGGMIRPHLRVNEGPGIGTFNPPDRAQGFTITLHYGYFHMAITGDGV